jgi:hypothetical protein
VKISPAQSNLCEFDQIYEQDASLRIQQKLLQLPWMFHVNLQWSAKFADQREAMVEKVQMHRGKKLHTKIEVQRSKNRRRV